jgi:hypothetical protein
MWKKLKRLLLPFEFQDHPLYAKPYEEPSEDWDDLGVELTGRPEAFRRSHAERTSRSKSGKKI